MKATPQFKNVFAYKIIMLMIYFNKLKKYLFFFNAYIRLLFKHFSHINSKVFVLMR